MTYLWYITDTYNGTPHKVTVEAGQIWTALHRYGELRRTATHLRLDIVRGPSQRKELCTCGLRIISAHKADHLRTYYKHKPVTP